MTAVAGLFERREDVEKASTRLLAAGLAPDHVQILDSPHAVWRHMDCSHRRSVLKDAAIGAALIGAVYGIFGVFAGLCDSTIGVPAGWCVGAAIVFLLIGAGLGAFSGALIGRAEAEKDTHLYLEGARRGDFVILAQVDDDLVSQAMHILRQERALGVRICDRARQLQQARDAGHIQPT